MSQKTTRPARFARPGMAALVTLLAMLGLVIGAGPAQADSSTPDGVIKTVTAPLTLKGTGDVTTNATVTGTCGSIFLNVRLASVNKTKLTYGYKSTQGPVSAHNLFGVYLNPPTLDSGTFGNVGSPNTADFETSETVVTGIPSIPAAFLKVSVTTPNGPCFGVVAESILF